MFEFARVLKRAADKALKKGQITEADVRTIRRARFHPFLMLALRKRVTEEAVLAGYLPAQAAENLQEIDWDAFLDFLRELLPLILEFIQALLILF